jgi:tetratricopeptide (TPR) repeat protein
MVHLAAPPPPSDREQVRTILAGLARVNAWRVAAEHARSLADSRGELAQAEALGWEPLVALARVRVGQLLDYMGRYEEAEEELQRAWFDAMRSEEYDVAGEAGTLLTFIVGFELARHREGLLWAQQAELAIEQLGDRDGLRRARLLSHRGAVRYAQGDYEAAYTDVTEALAIRERAVGPDDQLVAESLGDVSNVEEILGRPERSRELLARALAIEEAGLGPHHPLVAITLINLGNVERTLGNLDAAAPLFERGLAIQRNAFGAQHADVASTLNNYAVLFLARGDDQRGRELLEESLAIKRKARGAMHPEVALGLVNLAEVRERMGDHEDSRKMLEEALRIYEATMGSEHLDVAMTLHELGALAIRDGRSDEAIPLLERELDVLEQGKGPGEAIADARLLLAQALWAEPESHARAIDLARAARDQQRERGLDSAAAEQWLSEHTLR